MAYVDIPKDLTSVKTKVMFNLTKRQLICFGGGALIGVPLFFVLKSCLPISAAALIMIIAMLPFFLLAMSAAGKARPQLHTGAVCASQAASLPHR